MIFKYNEIQKFIADNFESFKNEVINELINYYGKEYKEVLKSRINETNFIFYVSPRFNDLLMYNARKKSNYKQLKKEYKIIKRIIRRNKESGIMYNRKSKNSDVYSSIAINNIIGFTFMYDNNEKETKKEIFLPLFYAGDAAIIHEMIHAAMTSPLLLTQGKNGENLKYKFGIGYTDDDAGNLLEECFTHIDTMIISKRLMEKKISFINQYYLFDEVISHYDNFIPSIIDLYRLYWKEINNARITLNSRQFIYSIGPENYCELISLLYDFDYYFDDCDKSYYRFNLKKCVENIKKYKNINSLILRKN